MQFCGPIETWNSGSQDSLLVSVRVLFQVIFSFEPFWSSGSSISSDDSSDESPRIPKLDSSDSVRNSTFGTWVCDCSSFIVSYKNKGLYISKVNLNLWIFFLLNCVYKHFVRRGLGLYFDIFSVRKENKSLDILEEIFWVKRGPEKEGIMMVSALSLAVLTCCFHQNYLLHYHRRGAGSQSSHHH